MHLRVISTMLSMVILQPCILLSWCFNCPQQAQTPPDMQGSYIPKGTSIGDVRNKFMKFLGKFTGVGSQNQNRGSCTGSATATHCVVKIKIIKVTDSVFSAEAQCKTCPGNIDGKICKYGMGETGGTFKNNYYDLTCCYKREGQSTAVDVMWEQVYDLFKHATLIESNGYIMFESLDIPLPPQRSTPTTSPPETKLKLSTKGKRTSTARESKTLSTTQNSADGRGSTTLRDSLLIFLGVCIAAMSITGLIGLAVHYNGTHRRHKHRTQKEHEKYSDSIGTAPASHHISNTPAHHHHTKDHSPKSFTARFSRLYDSPRLVRNGSRDKKKGVAKGTGWTSYNTTGSSVMMTPDSTL